MKKVFLGILVILILFSCGKKPIIKKSRRTYPIYSNPLPSDRQIFRCVRKKSFGVTTWACTNTTESCTLTFGYLNSQFCTIHGEEDKDEDGKGY